MKSWARAKKLNLAEFGELRSVGTPTGPGRCPPSVSQRARTPPRD